MIKLADRRWSRPCSKSVRVASASAGLSRRELRLRQCPQIVAIAALNRNRIVD